MNPAGRNRLPAPIVSLVQDLIQELLTGRIRALARAITIVENRAEGWSEILRQLFPHTGQSRIVGITGSPGVGKSSLVDKMATAFRQRGHRPAVVAVDPSSPFTGGAILGDRIRMAAAASDPGIFVRSMATRGHLGGLAAATIDVVTVLDAASRDPLLVETVGVGQDEIDIVKLADVSVVVLAPGMGDDIQALKAGIMEIGDVFAINKSDHPGTEKTERSILALLELAHRPDGWVPPIVRTVATEGTGIDALIDEVDRSVRFFEGSPARTSKKRDTARQRLMALLQERMRVLLERTYPEAELDRVLDRIARHEEDPHAVVETVIRAARTAEDAG